MNTEAGRAQGHWESWRTESGCCKAKQQDPVIWLKNMWTCMAPYAQLCKDWRWPRKSKHVFCGSLGENNPDLFLPVLEAKSPEYKLAWLVWWFGLKRGVSKKFVCSCQLYTFCQVSLPAGSCCAERAAIARASGRIFIRSLKSGVLLQQIQCLSMLFFWCCCKTCKTMCTSLLWPSVNLKDSRFAASERARCCKRSCPCQGHIDYSYSGPGGCLN